MTIPYSIQIGDSLTEEEIGAIESLILSTFSTVHHTYNNWNPQSEISTLNRLAKHQPVTLSQELNEFLLHVNHIVQLTEGRFDPTVAPLKRLWQHYLVDASLPSEEEIEQLASSTGWEKIHIENGLFWKDNSLTTLDLGGIAKGYTVDLLLAKLHDAGYQNIFVEWGGEIRSLGQHPQGRSWKVRIAGSSDQELHDEAIATSGTYLQNWSVENVSYSHIIDPKTSWPLRDAPITSATVIAPTCIEADGIATALMLFASQEEAQEWAEQHGFKVFIW